MAFMWTKSRFFQRKTEKQAKEWNEPFFVRLFRYKSPPERWRAQETLISRLFVSSRLVASVCEPAAVETKHRQSGLLRRSERPSRANVQLFHFLSDVAKKEEKRQRVRIMFPKWNHNFYIKQKGNEPAAAARRGARRLMTCRVPVTKISNPPQSPKT